MSRILPDFLDAFMDWTDGSLSPPRFRRWAGLSTISAALKRSVHTRIVRKTQYPNLYVILVGQPGSGKGVAMRFQKDLLVATKTIKMTPAAVTKRSFIKAVEGSKDRTTNIVTGLTTDCCAITGCIDELGTFLQENDMPFMEVLADLYDNPDVWDYSTQHVGEHHLENTTFNLIAGTQPRYIGRAFTQDALEMGFPARLIMVYDDPVGRVASLFSEDSLEAEKLEMEEKLGHDLNQITLMNGEYVWDSAARDELEAWYQRDLHPIPADSRFEHYNTRRLAHITKLTMLVSSSRSSDLIMTLEDLRRAKEILLDAEAFMPRAISRMGANPIRQYMINAVKVIGLYCNDPGNDKKKGMPEHRLRAIMGQDIEPRYMLLTISELIAQKAIKSVGEEPNRFFWPR